MRVIDRKDYVDLGSVAAPRVGKSDGSIYTAVRGCILLKQGKRKSGNDIRYPVIQVVIGKMKLLEMGLKVGDEVGIIFKKNEFIVVPDTNKVAKRLKLSAYSGGNAGAFSFRLLEYMPRHNTTTKHEMADLKHEFVLDNDNDLNLAVSWR